MERSLIHGKRGTYTNDGCRCRYCKEANAKYKAEKVSHNIHVRASTAIKDLLENKEQPFTHGQAVSYEWHGCRCEACKEAVREVWQQSRLLRSLSGR